MWSKSAIATAKLFKEFQGCFNRDILSTNPKTASIALDTLPSRPSQKNKSVKHEQTIHDKRPFSIQARAHLKGVLIWA